MWGKGNSYTVLGEREISTATMDNRMEAPQNTHTKEDLV